MSKPFTVIFNILTVIYPVTVFLYLVVFKLPVRIFSLFLGLLALSYVSILSADKTANRKKRAAPLFTATLFLAIAIAGAIADSAVFLHLYPVFVNAGLLCVFAASYPMQEPIIYRFALLQSPSIRASLSAEQIRLYCKKVTLVWCGFFVINGGIAVYTAFFTSEAVWSVYNGAISYVFMGILFIGEFVVRKTVQRNLPEAVPLSAVTARSRKDDTVLCYEGTWSQKVYKTWADFLTDTAKLRSRILNTNAEKWILHCEDEWFFLTAYAALLQCGRQIQLTANVTPSFIAEIKKEGTILFTDRELPDSISIQDTIANSRMPSKEERNKVPAVSADDTVIHLYTSGSTGSPKAVCQRLTEFELDNTFILSRWGQEFLTRKLCSTVSQHHIYGLLFSVMLPFTAGVPFRRKRIEHPEEFNSLTDTSYMIITVPAFLKRAAETDSPYPLQNPWIWTSGGVLQPETAKKVNDIFGFWPIEVYGSTETSGIAWRCSRSGSEWTPFENAEITLNEDGCLKVRSPYIKAAEGFITGDLADILADGRFILKGRADSIVKIEEKRISVTEIENRLLQSGLVKEVCVAALDNGRRQYLGAAAVLNDEGLRRFRGMEKLAINTYFRDYLSAFLERVLLPKKWRFVEKLPEDAQGKKKRTDILALFADTNTAEPVSGEQVISRNDHEVVLQTQIPADSDFFNGHFPDFPILPAVAQVSISMKYAAHYLGMRTIPQKIKRIKFSDMVFPDAPLRITLTASQNFESLSMLMESPDRTRVYSKGTILFGGTDA